MDLVQVAAERQHMTITKISNDTMTASSILVSATQYLRYSIEGEGEGDGEGGGEGDGEG